MKEKRNQRGARRGRRCERSEGIRCYKEHDTVISISIKYTHADVKHTGNSLVVAQTNFAGTADWARRGGGREEAGARLGTHACL